jgi:hypothetical protein
MPLAMSSTKELARMAVSAAAFRNAVHGRYARHIAADQIKQAVNEFSRTRTMVDLVSCESVSKTSNRWTMLR